jgi:hypothetical protein
MAQNYVYTVKFTDNQMRLMMEILMYLKNTRIQNQPLTDQHIIEDQIFEKLKKKWED